jgi:hypothetical protein
MNCPRCGKVSPAGVAACTNCGTPLGNPSPTQSVTMPAAAASLSQAYDKQKRRNSTVIAVIAAVAIVALVMLLTVRGLSALGIGAKADETKALSSKGKLPGVILTAQGKPISPVLTRPAPDQERMPDDVLAWLRHLEKCEAMKVEIAGDQAAEMAVLQTKLSALGAAIGLTDPYDQSTEGAQDQSPDSYIKGKMMDLRPQWEQLLDYFHSVTPPAECRPIADDYERGLGEIPGMMGDLADVLNMASTDPANALQSVKKMQNSSYDINRSFARTDQKVGAICAKYNVNKWFNIKQDVEVGGMMGTGGGAGLPQIPGMSGGLPGQ